MNEHPRGSDFGLPASAPDKPEAQEPEPVPVERAPLPVSDCRPILARFRKPVATEPKKKTR